MINGDFGVRSIVRSACNLCIRDKNKRTTKRMMNFVREISPQGRSLECKIGFLKNSFFFSFSPFIFFFFFFLHRNN